jgi:Methyltransferase domain
MGAHRDGAPYWDEVYAGGDASRSWFQACPLMSLTMLDAAGVTASDSVIDVGGGASRLAGALLGRGFRDITVLDISATGTRYAQDQLGEQAQQVQWLVADVLAWEPTRRFRVWHDRAVFHFLTSSSDQHRYVRILDAATDTDAVAVFGCFAPDGPQRCSGLPVARYDVPALAGHLGHAWTLCAGDREEHITPAGVMQPFTWAAFRKAPGHRHVNGI